MKQFLTLAITLCCMFTGYSENYPLYPDSNFSVNFPELPKTFAGKEARMDIYIPQDYSKSKETPLLIYVGGGYGSSAVGPSRQLCDKQNFICVGFPTWKEDFNKPSQKNLLYPGDTDINYDNWMIMIAKLEEIFPNLSKDVRVIGGFSNGAHCISMLYQNKRDFKEKFKYFYFADGGIWLKSRNRVRGTEFIMVMGEKSSMNAKGKAIYRKVKSRTSEFFLQKDVGHSFAQSGKDEVKKWLKNKVLKGKEFKTVVSK